MTLLSPREREVAYGCGQRWTVKKIAAEMGISRQRVHVLIAAVAVKIGVCEGCDDRICVGDWWQVTMTDRQPSPAVLKLSTA